MSMSEELDDTFIDEKEHPFRAIVKWWEKRRKWYALIMVLVQSFLFYQYWDGISNFGIEAAFIFSVIFFLLANVCYCVGWGIEILLAYYFKSYYQRATLSYILFILGILFSLVVTLFTYDDVFWYYRYYAMY